LKGHSHWQNIKSTKGKKDEEFSKLLVFYQKKINQTIRDGGADPKKNKMLDKIILDGQKENIPLTTLQKIVQRAASKPTETTYIEVKGPQNCHLIVACNMGSKSQALNSVKHLMKKSVPFAFSYNDPTTKSYFNYLGVVWIRKDSAPPIEVVDKETKKSWGGPPPKDIPPPLSLDDAENLAIELNAESVTPITDDEDKEAFEIICDPNHVRSHEMELSKRNFIVRKAETEFRPICRIKLTKQNQQIVNQLYEILNNIEDIENIFDNIEFDDEE